MSDQTCQCRRHPVRSVDEPAVAGGDCAPGRRSEGQGAGSVVREPENAFVISIMRLPQLVLVMVMTTCDCSCGHAMFAFSETQKVPIDRLFTNLQQRLAKNTNDFETTYHLARLHSMAYATNLAEVNVTKKEGSPVFYDSG